MGHAKDYLVAERRKDIMSIAQEYAFYNTDRGENPHGDYHGRMTIHDDIICESYEDAVETINNLDRGFYNDHAVKFKDKSQLKPTKQMLALQAKGEKIMEDLHDYEDKHSIKERKSKFVGCRECESKLAVKRLRGNKCPVCGADLRADYIVERIAKYHEDYKDTLKKYSELRKKQSGKCPVRWLVKVEVHC